MATNSQIAFNPQGETVVVAADAPASVIAAYQATQAAQGV